MLLLTGKAFNKPSRTPRKVHEEKKKAVGFIIKLKKNDDDDEGWFGPLLCVQRPMASCSKVIKIQKFKNL